MLQFKEHFHYPKVDTGTNETVFSREPFIARFHSHTTCENEHIGTKNKTVVLYLY